MASYARRAPLLAVLGVIAVSVFTSGASEFMAANPGILQPGVTKPAFSHRTVLVPMDTVRAIRGVDADAIAAQVDAGELRWVFDVSAGQGQIRALRFWWQEVIAPDSTCRLTPAAVVKTILGERSRWRGVEVAQLLLVSRPHIFRLFHSGVLPGQIAVHTLYVNRPALETFLTRRLVGNT